MSSSTNGARPAILGGRAAFPGGLAFFRPATPPLKRVVARLEHSWELGVLTNGPLVRELEEAVAARLDVRHAVAVSSCTSGLLLSLRALRLSGRVVLPSFTFSASAHAVAWNGLEPVFAECDRATFQVDPADLEARVAACDGVLATHVFGAPCDVERVTAAADTARVPVVFDAAHALGTKRRGEPIGGFGDAEVFSLSPTKPVVAGEGGMVTTDRDDVAEAVRIGRDYANPGDYDTRFIGLNARMSELHAALALESLHEIDENQRRRRAVAARYRAGLSELPGITPQAVDEGDESSYKDFTVIIDEEFGLRRDTLGRALLADGVDTRRYFDPPVHRHQMYAHLPPVPLPVTDDVASRVISLPMSAVLPPEAADRVVEVIAALHEHATDVEAMVAP
jgi:dTDP-4-amino-4,6-dideoxygalactose transaminase